MPCPWTHFEPGQYKIKSKPDLRRTDCKLNRIYMYINMYINTKILRSPLYLLVHTARLHLSFSSSCFYKNITNF